MGRGRGEKEGESGGREESFLLFCQSLFTVFFAVFASRVTLCTDALCDEEAESDLTREALCSESPSTTVSTSLSSPETCSPWPNTESASDARTCEC